MADVVIDTDVASLLQRERSCMGRSSREQRPGLAQFVTVGELAKWAEVRRWGRARREGLDAWVARRPVIPYDETIANLGSSRVRRNYVVDQGRTTTLDSSMLPPLSSAAARVNRRDFTDFVAHHGLVLLTEES